MKLLIFIFYPVIFIFSLSCQEDTERHDSLNLSGYWIPKQVKWEIEDPRYKDSGRMFETAHFKTLIFNTRNEFIFFGSTQRHQRIKNDSLVFAGEPLFTVFSGKWKKINDTLLQVNYKPLEYNVNPPDKRERLQEIKILFHKNNTLLLFENQLYRRTDKFDSKSVQTIKEYKNEYLNQFPQNNN
jgi:hypothetical protein